MAILLCGKCGYFREVGNEYAGKSVACPQCKQANTIHDTIRFLKNVIQRELYRIVPIRWLTATALGQRTAPSLVA